CSGVPLRPSRHPPSTWRSRSSSYGVPPPACRRGPSAPGLLRPIHANLASYASPTPSPIRVPLRVRGCAVSNVHWLDATLGSRPQSSCLRILLMHLADVLPHIHVPGASARPLDRGDRAARQPVHEGGDLHGKMPPSIVTARLDGGSESVTSDN